MELQTRNCLRADVFPILVAFFSSRLSVGSFESFLDSLGLHREDRHVAGVGGLLQAGGQVEAVHQVFTLT